jgi:hypothetical protein
MLRSALPEAALPSAAFKGDPDLAFVCGVR